MAITRLARTVLGGIFFTIIFASTALAAENCQTVVGRLATVDGQVEVQRMGNPNWQGGVLGGDLCQGDTVRAGANSRATIALINQAVLRIDQNTAMRLDNISGVTEERSVLSLLKGAFQSFSRKPRGFEVNTPYLNGSIEGTEFVFRAEDGQSELTVLEGIVIASNAQGKVSVSGGESAVAEPGKAPYMRTVVSPRDAVQWSLYYPPVIAAGGENVQASLQDAASLLSAGRVEEAQTSISDALQQNPKDGLAYALRAVINVVQNNNDQALLDANQAVEYSPRSTAAKIALSYAQQANYQIQAARDTLLQAVNEQPDAALAWARLSELQLMLGNREQAIAAADKATALAPDLEKTQITLGFAALAAFDNAAAKAAFERAITLSSSDPMAHLGLGLAKISSGNIEAGGRDIEVAVALDSNSALLRAYLGKTYFAERRYPLDSEQFSIAKQLDPNDPTAYLYDGILKQTVNRPVEALQDFDRSIELNDNRAVYRGRLLLDKDRAARGTSLARVYNDLGFTALGVNEATQSLSIDPQNASAHRFLSDIYKDVSGRVETARVSELLQSQLFQDINLNPVQPSVSSNNLNIVTAGGPAEAGFNEFTPLFERNQTQLNITGFGGSNDTTGGEAVLSSVYNSLSGSIGYFDYDTDGYRDNNGLRHKIWDVYGQWAVSSAFNLQTEYRNRDTEYGDLAQNFDLDDFDSTLRTDTIEKMYRFGARISPNQQSDILMSFIRSQIDSTKNSVPVDESVPPEIPGFPDGYFRVTEESDASLDTDQYDVQYVLQKSLFKLVAGASYSDSDTKERIASVASFEFPPVVPPTTEPPFFIDADSETDDKRLYAYSDWIVLPSVTGTVGFSYVDFEDDVKAFDKVDFDRFNPKLGIRWDINNGLTARAAYFKNVMPVTASKRTLEPTQVAGFNQFYDDPNATKSTRYGAALDWEPNEKLAFGTELTKRDVETAVLDASTGRIPFEDSDEWDYRAYGNWTPTNRWSLSLEASYDKFENESNSLVASSVPKRVTTKTVPAKVTYFHPSGFFGGVNVTYIDQEVRREQVSLLDEGDSSFTLTDLSVGYRLPKRRGVISLTVQNLFDKDFKYQDESYRTFRLEPYVSPYVPETTVMGRVTLSF
jgi:tetratricopeptide (TPR) repeat protein